MDFLESLRQHLMNHPGVQLAALFGSFARHQQTRSSDIDIAVRLKCDTPEARNEIELGLWRVARREVDVIYMDGAPPQLRFEISRDGILWVEREPYAWADFRARSMIDWWDWAPTARRHFAAACRRVIREVSDGTR